MPHQRPHGYQISKSKIITASVDAAFTAWTDESVRNKWLIYPVIAIRKATLNHTLRITWVDGFTSLNVSFYSRGEKVHVSVNHRNLSDSQKAEVMKEYWADQLIKLADFLEFYSKTKD